MFSLRDMQLCWIEGWYAAFANEPQLNPYVHTHESSPDKPCLACVKLEERESQSETDRAFGRLVQGWIERSGVTDLDLMREFDLSVPTCWGWRAGACASHPALRDHIRSYFEGLLHTASCPRCGGDGMQLSEVSLSGEARCGSCLGSGRVPTDGSASPWVNERLAEKGLLKK